MVIITHSCTLLNRTNEDWLGKLSAGYFPFSFYGVRIFFIISGYLIAQSLENSTNLLDYIWKRVLRLFPGLIVVVCFSVFIIGPVFTSLSWQNYFQDTLTWRYFRTILIFRLENKLPGVFDNAPSESIVNGSLWTLAYEFSCYLFLIVLQRLRLIKTNWIAIPLLLLLWVMDYHDQYNEHRIPMYGLVVKFLYEFSLYFFIGSWFYYNRSVIQYRRLYFFVCLMLYGFLLSLQQPHILRQAQYFLLPYVVFYLAFLAAKTNHWGRYGDFSYGIYIYSFLIQQCIIQIFGGNLSIFALIILSFIIVLPLAWLSWNFIEKPALKFKSLFK
jgi:peptidoglycan/LPS O-acetylase OafA/YrhL